MNNPDPASEEKPFLDHLEDLRGALIRSGAALAAGVLVAWPFAPNLLRILERPLMRVVPDAGDVLRSLHVAGAFTLSLRIAFWAGLLLSLPAALYFVAQFVLPGLTAREKAASRVAWRWGAGLFVVGVSFGYFAILPAALRVMLETHAWMGIRAEWIVTDYVAFTIRLLIGFGLVFEMPVVMLLLGRLGIVSAGGLRQGRKYAWIAILVVSALLTPPDVFSQLLMAGPLALLYEICILLLPKQHKGATRDG